MRGRILVQKIREAFPPQQAEVLEELFDFLDELVKVHDFNELKGIVAALAEEQRKLAEAQRRTEEKIEALAEAQRRTEEELKKLIKEHHTTKHRLDRLVQDFGRFTRTYSYAFENKAYRNLLKFLKEKYNHQIIERFIRTEIEREENNFFAKT